MSERDRVELEQAVKRFVAKYAALRARVVELEQAEKDAVHMFALALDQMGGIVTIPFHRCLDDLELVRWSDAEGNINFRSRRPDPAP